MECEHGYKLAASLPHQNGMLANLQRKQALTHLEVTTQLQCPNNGI